MFKLIKATAFVSMVTIVNVIAGMIRAKFTAVKLGPAGVGILSQAMNFQYLIVSVASLSIGLGIAKYVAQYKAQGDNTKISQVVSYSIFMQTITFVIIFLIAIFLYGFLSKFLFSTTEYSNYLILPLIGAIFLIWVSTIEATMLGLGNYMAFARSRSVSSVAGLIPLFVFVFFMGVKGGFLYQAASGILTFIIYCVIFKKSVPADIMPLIKNGIARFVPEKNTFNNVGKSLLLYGGASFAGSVLSMGNIIIVRSLLITYFGSEANGYYQVVFMMSAYYIAFFTNGLWSYLYARMSSIKDKDIYSIEINQALRFCIFGIVPIVTAIFLLRGIIINTVFSNEFQQSGHLFATQLMGDIFFITFYIMGTSLLASTKLKEYILSGLMYSIVYIGSFICLKNIFGLETITISYLMANAVLAVAIFYYHFKTMGFNLYWRNTKLFVSAIIICIFILFSGWETAIASFSKIIIVILWLFFFSTATEKRKLMAIAKNRIAPMIGARNGR